jgi:hypothetical protein
VPADNTIHRILDAIYDSGDPEFIDATELLLRTTLRGAIASQHSKRFPGSSAEAVQYTLLPRKKSIRPRNGKNNG